MTTTKRRAARRALLGGVAAGALSLLCSAPALAGTLTVYGGAKPDGTAVPAGPWTGINDGQTTGGAFGVSMPGFSGPGWSQTASLSAPPSLAFASVTAVRSYDAPVSFNTSQPRISTTWENPGWWGGGYGGDSGSGSVTATNPSSLTITVNCEMNYYNPPNNCSGGGRWTASRMEYVLRDDTMPDGSLTDGGGELLGAGWQTAPASTLTINASDGQSGVYRAFVNVGGTKTYASVDPSNTACQDARAGVGSDYEFAARTSTLVPCRTAARDYEVSFDLTKVGDGQHTNVSIGVEDASGNQAVIASGRTLRINAPGGTLGDPGTTGPGGCLYQDDGSCILPPSNTVPPSIAGTPKRGDAVTFDRGEWTNVDDATFSQQWQRCATTDASSCSNISGATNATYTPVLADVDKRLRVVVTATTPTAGSATAASNITAVVASNNPVNVNPPSINGTLKRGSVLTSDVGGWNDATGASFSRQWQRCETASPATCSNITGAIGASYTPALADVDKRLRLAVTASKSSSDTVTAYSPITSAVADADPVAPSTGGGGTAPSGGGGAPAGGGGGSADAKKNENADKKQEAPKPENTPNPDSPSPVPANNRGPVNGVRGTDQAQLKAVFDRTKRTVMRSRYGKPVAITGRLTTKAGEPIEAANLDVDARVAGGRSYRADHVRTRGDGSFKLTLPGNIVGQTIRIGYRSHANDEDPAEVAPLTLRVAATADLSVRVSGKTIKATQRARRAKKTPHLRAHNGSRLTFRAKIGGPIPVGGKTIQLQSRCTARGCQKGWTNFGPSGQRTDRKGVFRWSIKTTGTVGTVTYRFRVVVPEVDGASNDWPFVTGISPVQTLTIHGGRAR